MKIISFFAIILTMAIILFGCGNEQDNVVISYCKSLEAGKFDESVSYLSKSAKQALENAGGKPALAVTSDAIKMRKGIKKINILKKDVNGAMATIKYEYNFKDGSSTKEIMHLIMEDGKWKISM